MTARLLAQRAARLAAYGNVDIKTPADWTLLECFEAMRKEKEVVKTKKGKGVEVDESALGPIFVEDEL
jgi:hypothetical protein